MSDYKDAIWIGNNNFFPNTGKKSFIILHGTAGGSSAQGIAAYFQNTEGTNSPASTHYVIGKDGAVVQTVEEKHGAFGNGVVTNSNWGGNPNAYTISIEHVKNHLGADGKPDNSDELTDAQKQASFKLVKDICLRNSIGMHDATDSTGITGHFAIDPVNRARCPGNYPWQELFEYLNGNQPIEQEQDFMITLATPGVSSYFEGDNVIWKCKKTGKLIGHAGLDFYRKHGDGLCGLTHIGLPLTDSIGAPNKPGVVYQFFERAVMIYDPERKVDAPPGATGPIYLMHIDSGLGMDPRIAQLVTQVSTLQGEIERLKELPSMQNLSNINGVAQKVNADVELIMKLSQVQ